MTRTEDFASFSTQLTVVGNPMRLFKILITVENISKDFK